MTGMALRTRRILTGFVFLLCAFSCDNASDPSTSNVESIAFAASSVTISQGESRTLGVTVSDASGRVLNDVTGIEWQTSNAAVLSVTQSGEVRGLALGGPVTVSARIGGRSAEATATVIPARIAFSPNDSNIVLGSTLQLSGTLLDHAGAPISGNAQVVWASNNPTVATVGSATGLVTSVSPGETSVSATAAGRTSLRTFRVGIPSQ